MEEKKEEVICYVCEKLFPISEIIGFICMECNNVLKKHNKHSRFNYGVIIKREMIYKDKVYGNFKYQYCFNGKKKSKVFSYGFKTKRSQRTEEEAYKECCEYRKKIYPECPL